MYLIISDPRKPRGFSILLTFKLVGCCSGKGRSPRCIGESVNARGFRHSYRSDITVSCRGSYKRVPCAIKVIFSTDLKEEDINKAAVEATLLSSVKSPNVVDIYGICVNPPNVCMILEICLFGSLSDVLRNGKVTLCYADKMYLALGCCRGLAALHAFSEDLVHRDIKSMNFLVDGQLTAKLADLELGQVESLSEKKSPNSKNTQGFLLNWMPPEVRAMWHAIYMMYSKRCSSISLYRMGRTPRHQMYMH